MFLPKCQILIWKTAMVTCSKLMQNMAKVQKKIKCQLQTRKPREVVLLKPSDAQAYKLTTSGLPVHNTYRGTTKSWPHFSKLVHLGGTF